MINELMINYNYLATWWPLARNYVKLALNLYVLSVAICRFRGGFKARRFLYIPALFLLQALRGDNSDRPRDQLGLRHGWDSDC